MHSDLINALRAFIQLFETDEHGYLDVGGMTERIFAGPNKADKCEISITLAVTRDRIPELFRLGKLAGYEITDAHSIGSERLGMCLQIVFVTMRFVTGHVIVKMVFRSSNPMLIEAWEASQLLWVVRTEDAMLLMLLSNRVPISETVCEVLQTPSMLEYARRWATGLGIIRQFNFALEQ